MKQFNLLRSVRHVCGLAIACLLLAGCAPSISLTPPQAGNVRFDTYIAWGDAYTAGLRQTGWTPEDQRGLYEEGQHAAYPALLAQQFQQVTSITFTQHLAPNTGSGYWQLQALSPSGCESALPNILWTQELSTLGWTDPPISPPHNMAVPWLQVSQLNTDSLSHINLFARRLGILGAYQTHMRERTATFSTVWLGMHDVLAHAMTGSGNVAFSLTSPDLFAERYRNMLENLTANAAVGSQHILIGNVPDLTRFPYFSTLPPLFKATEACEDEGETIYVRKGDGSVQPASSYDRILLPARDLIGQSNGTPYQMGLHPDNPLANQWVLDAEEAGNIRQTIGLYNACIDSLVHRHNAAAGYEQLLCVDLHQWFEHLSIGYVEDGLVLSNAYLTGGVFDADGLFLTPRGNAFVANAFIDAINNASTWEARIPPLNLADFAGVAYP